MQWLIDDPWCTQRRRGRVGADTLDPSATARRRSSIDECVGSHSSIS
jgi:hypothetical protein